MAKSNAIEKIGIKSLERIFSKNTSSDSSTWQHTRKKGRWNNTDYYQLGYAYYKQNDFENAISQFNKL
jgi:TolA-binding protein